MTGTERLMFAALGAVTVYFLFLREKRPKVAVPVGPQGMTGGHMPPPMTPYSDEHNRWAAEHGMIA